MLAQQLFAILEDVKTLGGANVFLNLFNGYR